VVVPGGRALLARRQPAEGAAGIERAVAAEAAVVAVVAVAPDPVDDPELPQAASPTRATTASAVTTSRRVNAGERRGDTEIRRT
jgi:hypothetical protein